MSKPNAKPTVSQKGTFNKGKAQGFNHYKGGKKGQSGSAGGKK